MKRTKHFTYFLIIAAAAFFAFPRTAKTADITAAYESNSMYWLFSDAKAGAPQLPMELAENDLPVEVRFKLTDVNQEAVLRAVTFIYPEGTPPEKRISLVEIWTTPKSEKKGWRLAYKGELPAGDAAPRAETAPTLARWVIFRFYTSNGGSASVLPAPVFEGDPEITKHPGATNENYIDRPYVFFIDDNPMGDFYVSREDAGDGGFKYSYDYSFSMNFKFPFGGGEHKLNMRCEAEVDTDSLFIAQNLREKCPDEHASVKGSRTPLGFELEPKGIKLTEDEDEDSGSSRKKRHKFETKNTEENQLHDVALFEKLASDGLAVGVEREYPTVLPLEGRFIIMKVAVLEYFPARQGRSELYAVWAHDDSNEHYNQVALIQPDGKMIRNFDYTNSFEMWMVDDPEEWDIQPYVIDYEKKLEALRQDVNKVVAQPDLVTRARMKIRWNEVPPERMNLDGPRQKVVSVTEVEPGVYEAELEAARRYPGDPELVEGKPLTEEELDSYLLYDDVVDTESSKIAKLADQIAGEETDQLEIAIKIFNWLIRNIEPKDKEEFYVPAARDMLVGGTGDCKYFAVLFASLARRKGIPTRFVFGQRYIGGEFGYHVWNQIYIDGSWLDVDASDLNFFPGAIRVQLDTGAAFNEKGHIGALLGFRPDPEVEILENGTADFQVVDSSRDTVYSNSYYQDAFFRCRVNFPGKLEHEVYDLGFAKKIVFRIPKQNQFVANVYIIPKPKDMGDNPDTEDIAKEMIGALSGMMSESLLTMDLLGAVSKIRTAKAGETQIAGRNALFLTGFFTDRKGDYYHFDLNFAGLKNCLALFYFAAPSDVFSKYNDNISYIKQAFEGF